VVNYELPFGQGKKWAASGWKKIAIGGFELSWIQTQESGNPITFSYAGSPFNTTGFAGSQRPDIIGPSKSETIGTTWRRPLQHQ